MKKIFSLYAVLLLLEDCFADIPLDKNGNNKTTFSDFNYLPWVLGMMTAAAMLIFCYVRKNEKNATK